MKSKVSIVWFRRDLRVHDNPALCGAASDAAVLPIYILDKYTLGKNNIGEVSAGKCWLQAALSALNAEVENALVLFKQEAMQVFEILMQQFEIVSVHWNRCYYPDEIKRDTELKKFLSKNEILVNSHNGTLLWEPWKISKKDGDNYKVFTPYYRRGCLKYEAPRKPLAKPSKLNFHKKKSLLKPVSFLNLTTDKCWEKNILDGWDVSESGAKKRLKKFIKNGIDGYKDGRNFPAKDNVSRLSPYIHWGIISAHHVWYEVNNLKPTDDTDVFLSELGWREFSYYLLYHYPTMPKKNLQTKFDAYPWKKHNKLFKAWCFGKTGIPLVDAGMRELYATGYMHNRLRMVVGSFLVKNLEIHWKYGKEWFDYCLFDADEASNSAGWQWVAGCGADAAPFFRIFNPVLQSKKFDLQGEYLRKYLPELELLPDKYIHCPWEMPLEMQQKIGFKLGKDYPNPIVSLSESRSRALSSYKRVK